MTCQDNCVQLGKFQWLGKHGSETLATPADADAKKLNKLNWETPTTDSYNILYCDPLSTEFTTTIHYPRPSTIPRFANLGQWHPRRIGCLWSLQQLSDNILGHPRRTREWRCYPLENPTTDWYWFSYSPMFNHPILISFERVHHMGLCENRVPLTSNTSSFSPAPVPNHPRLRLHQEFMWCGQLASLPMFLDYS